jgi:proteasome assembly chaperone (PAC2) family protein
MKGPPKYDGQLGLHDASLIVGWGGDTGKLGETIADYLIKKLEGHLFYEIDPEDFFPLGGITIEDDLVQFPESQFFVCPSYNLVIFKSATPSFEFYRYFTQMLDVAERYCKIREVLAIGGMVSLTSHTLPRQLLGTFNSEELKNEISVYDIDCDSSYETPPGQKPTLNSFLLWVSKRRSLAGMGLWVPVPFYLMSVDDPKAQKKIMEFLNQRFRWEIDLREFDDNIKDQDQRINEVRNLYPEIDTYFSRLEGNLPLSEDENLKLVKQVETYLKEKADT